MNKIGVIEGFFGPEWSLEARKSYASFLANYGGGFYIYAPKKDALLRKRWRDKWESTYINSLSSLSAHFKNYKIDFGVGLSPFGLGEDLSLIDQKILEEKLSILNSIGVQKLGLFFDDMPSSNRLALTQIKCVKFVQQFFAKKIIFCPSYYSFDPILDKVFGLRPENYLEDLSVGIDKNISLAWTGPKVISPELSLEHLKEVEEILKRMPFIWENLFANDGPKNCQFLKLKPFSGRGSGLINQVEGYGLNMMNQPYLSQICFLASQLVLVENQQPESALEKALNTLCSKEFSQYLKKYSSEFLTVGLNNMSDDFKQEQINQLEIFPDLGAKEIIQWLRNEFLVGSECLTD